ncbi:hypothetical protein ONZ45_g17377 [Pleurotus djamor]|nr:hypothetical protein ONZ45_g17377 [Pleurotus djamor]
MVGVEKLRIDINIAEMPSSGTTMFPSTILWSHMRWDSEMTNLLYTAACKARCLHVCLSGYDTPTILKYLDFLPNPFSRLPGWDASNLKLEAMSFTNLETLPSSIAAHLVTATSITSLRLSGALCASLGHLNLITLPNLLHFEVDGYRIPPTSHLCSFFSRHPSITTLQLDIGLSLWDSDTWPSGHESISPKYLPKASTLSADVASATWLLHNAKTLPSLENVTISAAYIGAKLIPNVQLHRRLWTGLASRAKSSLSNLTLRDTEVIGRLIVATSPFSAVPDEPLPSIIILTLEGGRLNAPDSFPLHTSILNALPAWIAKLFPSLRKLDLMHMKLRVPAAIENAFVFSMNEQCPYVGADHNIERLPHGGAGP